MENISVISLVSETIGMGLLNDVTGTVRCRTTIFTYYDKYITELVVTEKWHVHYWEKNYYMKQRKKKMYTETVSRERLLIDDAENMNRTTGNIPASIWIAC